MKKNKFSEFFKGKGYYVLLFIGVVAIAAVAIIGSQLSTNQTKKGPDYVDLNDTGNNQTADNNGNEVAENNPVSEDVTNHSSKPTTTPSKTNDGKTTSGNDAEMEGYTQDNHPGKDTGKIGDAVATEGKTIQNDYKAAIDKLSFNQDSKLAWPVNGNVLMNYSMDHTTYFATLMQYKVNPAIIIDAKVGTEVKSAAKGYVTKIDAKNDETGYTLTIGIGDGYTLTYGQLDKKSVSLKVGDAVEKGAMIGKIATPSKYYTVEGSNLFFEVMKKDKPVNPMLFLEE